MSTFSARRLLAAALISCCSGGLLATGAQASGSNTMEPVFLAGGLILTCDPNQDLTLAFRETLTSEVPGMPGIKPLSSSSIKTWALDGPANEQYQMCTDMSVPYLAQNFVRALRRFRNAEIAKNPAVNKIDIVGVSLGSTISRYCIKYNPLGGSPTCAQMIDDWVGVVPLSHGSTKFNATNCSWTAMYEKICRAAIPSSIVMDELNENGDETPFGVRPEYDPVTGAQKYPTGHIEYSTVWSENDGTIVPATSAMLEGALSRRVVNGFDSNNQPAGKPLTHETLLTQVNCPGGPTLDDSAPGEWVAYQLRDITPYSFLEDDGYLDCAIDGRQQG